MVCSVVCVVVCSECCVVCGIVYCAVVEYGVVFSVMCGVWYVL